MEEAAREALAAVVWTDPDTMFFQATGGAPRRGLDRRGPGAFLERSYRGGPRSPSPTLEFGFEIGQPSYTGGGAFWCNNDLLSCKPREARERWTSGSGPRAIPIRTGLETSTRTAQRRGECCRSTRTFPLVELNFTFYRSPTRPILLRLADKAPPSFQFLVKVPQTISHEQRPFDLPGFRHAVEGLAQGGQLLGVLAQFPQAMHCTCEACNWVTLSKELGHLRLAVEFRHRSCAGRGCPRGLRNRSPTSWRWTCRTFRGLFPGGCANRRRMVDIRLHSATRTNGIATGASATTTITPKRNSASGPKNWFAGIAMA